MSEALTEAELFAMTDEELRDRVTLEAYLALGRPHCVHDDNCSALYREANRREKPWIYARGWNRFCTNAGGTLTESDLRAAQGTSASGQDPQGLEAKPASAVPERNAPNGQ